MKPCFNDKYEKEIKEMSDSKKNFEELYNKFKNRYETTQYPGYGYAIGVLLENNRFSVENKKEYMSYYYEAAFENYLPALMKICENYFSNAYYETTLLGVSVYMPDYLNNLRKDPYGEFLLAKYTLIRSILMEEEYDYLKDGFALMQESANNGCKEAIKFVEAITKEE